MESGEARASMEDPSSSTTMTSSETLISQPDSEGSQSADTGAQSEQVPAAESSLNQTDLLKAVEVVERDSLAIAESFTSLFDSLRLALSESTSSTIDHMQCFSDAAGRIQESAIEAAARGNRFIISCHKLNEEMKGVDALAMQLYPCYFNISTLVELQKVGILQCLLSTSHKPGVSSATSSLSLEIVVWSVAIQPSKPAMCGKILRRNVDSLDLAVNRLLRIN